MVFALNCADRTKGEMLFFEIVSQKSGGAFRSRLRSDSAPSRSSHARAAGHEQP